MLTGKTKSGVNLNSLRGIAAPRDKKLRILVANQSSAKCFDRKHRETLLVAELDHPSGKLKGHELVTDRPGRAFDSHGGGSRHALTSAETPHEHEADQFAMFLSKWLKESHGKNEFDNLMLVAEPHFLGVLFSSLEGELQKICVEPLELDVGHMPATEIKARLEKALNPLAS